MLTRLHDFRSAAGRGGRLALNAASGEELSAVEDPDERTPAPVQGITIFPWIVAISCAGSRRHAELEASAAWSYRARRSSALQGPNRRTGIKCVAGEWRPWNGAGRAFLGQAPGSSKGAATTQATGGGGTPARWCAGARSALQGYQVLDDQADPPCTRRSHYLKMQAGGRPGLVVSVRFFAASASPRGRRRSVPAGSSRLSSGCVSVASPKPLSATQCGANSRRAGCGGGGASGPSRRRAGKRAPRAPAAAPAGPARRGRTLRRRAPLYQVKTPTERRNFDLLAPVRWPVTPGRSASGGRGTSRRRVRRQSGPEEQGCFSRRGRSGKRRNR